MPQIFDEPPTDKGRLERGAALAPRFDANGLVTAVVTDVQDGAVLMVAHMNAEALSLSIETGIAHFYSRSRSRLWKKGETSGNILAISEMRIDCDQDCLWLKVEVKGDGAACHTGARSCFYRRVVSSDGGLHLEADDERSGL
jgi:phosphoribosyl-AMP cyclohydrolase